MCVPVAVAYSLGVLVGVLPSTSSHYLEHAYPAMALVLAVPLTAIASTVHSKSYSAQTRDRSMEPLWMPQANP